MYQENEIKLEVKLKAVLAKNKKISGQLSKASKAIEQANQIKEKLERTQDLYGKDIFVNFGVGWATYRPIDGLPYIERNGQKILPTEGMSAKNGDTLYDGDGNKRFHWLSDYESSILDHYNNLSS